MATQPDRNNELVVSIFNNLDQARQAQKGIEAWDQSQPNIHLGSSTVLYKSQDGKIQYDRSGSFDWKREATANILILTMVNAKPLHNVFNVLSGVLSNWTKGIKSENIDQLSQQLDQGRAALCILCDDYEVQAVTQQLTSLGGSTITGYTVPSNTTSQVENAVQDSANQQGGRFHL